MFFSLRCHKTRSTCRETSSAEAPVALTAPSRGIKFYISREIIICAGAILTLAHELVMHMAPDVYSKGEREFLQGIWPWTFIGRRAIRRN
jgi:hypothetical protein